MQQQLFNTGWRYARIEGTFDEKPEYTDITLPHDAQISEPRNPAYETGFGGGYFRGGVYMYKKNFTLPEDWRGDTVSLLFEGAYQWAEVTLNNQLLATQPYGYSSFIVNLAEHVRFDADNLLEVKINNAAVPNSRWYSGAGLYRHVWLMRGAASAYIEPWGVQITTPEVSADSSVIRASVRLAGHADSVTVRHTVLDSNTIAATSTRCVNPYHGTILCEMSVSPAKLWDVDSPNLYTLRTELLVNGIVTDTVHTTFGIRSISADAANGFRLNGRRMKLKGGCVHHDNGVLGSASFNRAEERKIELLKAAGFNAIRCAHNPPAPAMLDACDKLGMLVIDENFDCWRMGKHPHDYHLFFEQWWHRDTEAMIRRDFNHPSIIMWSIGNEINERSGRSDGYMWANNLAGFVRSLDNTRLVTSGQNGLGDDMLDDGQDNIAANLANGQTVSAEDRWGIVTKDFLAPLDVAGYNYLLPRYASDAKTFPDRIIMGTETFPSQAFAYWQGTLDNPNVIGDFVWTALDYLGEAGIGRASYDPSVKLFSDFPWHQAICGDIDICGFKRPQSYFRDILWGLRDVPYIGVLHPNDYGKEINMSPWGWHPVEASWSFPGCEGKPVTVEVYSDKDEVELFVNDSSQGRKPTGKAQHNTAVFDVAYQVGTIKAVAYTNGKADGEFAVSTCGAPAAIRLTADRTKLTHGDGGDLAYVTVEVVDANGQMVPYADNEITFAIEGSGKLQAVGSGNAETTESYVGNTRKVWQGRAMAIVASTSTCGGTTLTASTNGLAGCSVTIDIQ